MGVGRSPGILVLHFDVLGVKLTSARAIALFRLYGLVKRLLPHFRVLAVMWPRRLHAINLVVVSLDDLETLVRAEHLHEVGDHALAHGLPADAEAFLLHRLALGDHQLVLPSHLHLHEGVRLLALLNLVQLSLDGRCIGVGHPTLDEVVIRDWQVH